MYAGHFAIGLALHARFPRVPLAAPIVGIGVLDLIDGLLVASGVDKVSAAPHEPLGVALDFVDWDHSLLMAVVWSALFAALFRKDRLAALVAFGASLSHFVADWPMHNGDLALWPYSQAHLGLYLWHTFPLGSWFLEGAFAAALVGYFAKSARANGASARAVAIAGGLVGLLHLNFFPALSPMHLAAARLPPEQLGLASGLLVFFGFVIPSLALMKVLAPRPAPVAAPAA